MRALTLGLVAIAVLALPLRPAAAAPSEAEREYQLGFRALEAGDCARALVHYQRSLELVPRPRTLFNMATCEEDLGLLADAWRRYHAFLDLAEDRDAELVVEAKVRIAALRGRLRGQVRVDSKPAGASVLVDGERASRGATPLTLSLQPGAHTIRIMSADSIAIERTVDVEPEAVETISVELALPSDRTVPPDPADASVTRDDGAAPDAVDAVDAVDGRRRTERVSLRPPPVQPAPENITVDFSRRDRSSGRPIAWSVGGLGAATVVAGGVFGVLALRDVASPDDDRHDRGKRRAWVADGLFVVGSVAVVAAWKWLAR